MNRLILLTILTSFVFGVKAQSWDEDDRYDNSNRGGQQNRNQGNQGCDNPYQDPNYYPNHYGNRSCPPPPPPSCRRNVVVVTPPPSYCAPVVIAPRPYPYFRPYGYNPYRRPYGYGYRPRGWRYR
jgi:hypothetical protein